MTSDILSNNPPMERRSPALTANDRALGLRRQVVTTSWGRVIVRASAATGGTATILLHGAAGSWTTWTPLLLAAERSGNPLTNVVAIDLPGWGESRAPASGLDAARLSRVVCEVAGALGYRRWIVVGHSLGGFVALDLAACAPSHAAGVLLISPSGPAVIDAIRHTVRGWVTLPGFAGMLLIMHLLARLGAVGAHLVRALNSAGILRVLSAPLFAEPAHVHHSVIDAFSEELRPRAFIDAARAAAAYDVSTWRAITCPVLAVRGGRDLFVRDSDCTEFAKLIPDFTQVTVHTAGHFAAIEQPDAVLDTIRLLAQLDKRPSTAETVPGGVDKRWDVNS
ncbi:alpha/beta hydrolase [Microbacterium deminutum]|uniref:Alpha/beta fold hydrolase n=1 Tax=Microbacterium deminutum TaxID=344164 RepID=A0ABN2RF08_9MICO